MVFIAWLVDTDEVSFDQKFAVVWFLNNYIHNLATNRKKWTERNIFYK